MAGHRREHGRPARAQARDERMAARMASAVTPEQRAAAAFDALRMAAARSPERGRPALEDAAGYLLGLAGWIRKEVTRSDR